MNRVSRKYIFLLSTTFILLLTLIVADIVSKSEKVKLPKIKRIVNLKGIEIFSEENQKISMFLSNKQWFIYPENYIVDESSIEEILSLLSNFEIVDFVSSGENPHIFELNKEKRYSLSLETLKNEKLTIYFGKTAPTRKHTYIQLPNDNNIYLAKGNFYYALHKKKEEFRSKKILSFVNEDIKSIEWTEDGKLYSIFPLEDLKKSFRWGASWKNGEINPEKISNFLLILNPLFAIEFPQKIPHPDSVLRKLVIKTITNTYEIRFHSTDKEGDYYISIKGDTNYYKITKFAGDNLLKSYTNF